MSSIEALQKAESLLDEGRAAEALPFLSRALRGAEDPFFIADVHHRRADALRALSRFDESLAAYWVAHRGYHSLGVMSERLRTLLGASACLRVLSRYRQADRMWASVENLLPPTGSKADPSSEECVMERALVLRGLGDMDGAVRALRSVIPMLTRKKDSEALQHAWWALAGAERFSGRYGEALKAFRKAEVLSKKNKDDGALAYAWCGSAGCLRILGDGDASLRLYRQAHALFKKHGDAFGQAYGFCGMGNSLRVYGDARAALTLYQRSSALYTKVGDVGSRAFAYWGMGGACRRLGMLDDAYRHYHRAWKEFSAVGDHRGVIMALLGLGRTEGDRKKISAAARWIGKALVHARKEKHPYEAALALTEQERLAGKSLTLSRFGPFGITAKAVATWKDLP